MFEFFLFMFGIERLTRRPHVKSTCEPI